MSPHYSQAFLTKWIT